MLHKDNQKYIALAVAPQVKPRNEHIAINYHHFRSFVAKVDVEIKHFDTKEHMADIFTFL